MCICARVCVRSHLDVKCCNNLHVGISNALSLQSTSHRIQIFLFKAKSGKKFRKLEAVIFAIVVARFANWISLQACRLPCSDRCTIQTCAHIFAPIYCIWQLQIYVNSFRIGMNLNRKFNYFEPAEDNALKQVSSLKCTVKVKCCKGTCTFFLYAAFSANVYVILTKSGHRNLEYVYWNPGYFIILKKYLNMRSPNVAEYTEYSLNIIYQ